jgi:hypothetical protein
MNEEVDKTFEHVLKLQPGDDADIDFRFAIDVGVSVNVRVASVDLAAGTAELAIEDMWGSYRMEQFARGSGRWVPIWPADGDDVPATVHFGSGNHLVISSDLAYVHALDLIDVSWQGGVVRLTFIETA